MESAEWVKKKFSTLMKNNEKLSTCKDFRKKKLNNEATVSITKLRRIQLCKLRAEMWFFVDKNSFTKISKFVLFHFQDIINKKYKDSFHCNKKL